MQGTREALQLRLQDPRPGRARLGLSRVGPEQEEGVAQKLLAVGLVGRTPRLNERDRVALHEGVVLDNAEHAVLLVVRQAGELVRQRRTDRSLAERVRDTRREPSSQGDATIDPRRLVPEELADRARAQVLLVAERADHPGLVQGGARAGRRVGLEQPTLVLGARRGRRAHDGHERGATRTPVGISFEAVEDLEVAIVARRDEQRHLRARLGTAARCTRSQALVAGVQALDRDQAHATGHLVCDGQAC